MTSINPLSNPKGVKLDCELCGKTARIQCQFCKVTYYCSKEHQSTDWSGIHVKICQLLIPLRSPSKVLGSEEERKRRDNKVRQIQQGLFEMSKTEAHKHLNEGHYELAVPASLQSLKFAIELTGPASLELVPSYLLLGEASIGLHRFQQAEEYLSLAKYAVLKQPDCGNELKSQLHRNFGKLYSSLGKYDEAIKQLSNDIYYSSLQYGPEHIGTSGGYFQLGTVFLLQGRIDIALTMFDKVIDIWKSALREAIRTLEQSHVEIIDEASTAECLQMLTKILSTREEKLGAVHASTAESHLILGYLFRYTKNYEMSKEYTVRALEVYDSTVGQDHPSCIAAKKALAFFSTSVQNI